MKTNRTQAALKAWATRRAKQQKRSQAAVKANRTRKLTERAKSAWVTRRMTEVK